MIEQIESVSDLLNLIQKEIHVGEGKVRYYYRGHSNINYELIPKLLRKKTFDLLSEVYGQKNSIRLQTALLSRFIRYIPVYYGEKMYPSLRNNEEKFGLKLCLAQHHGLPTLLLDWTLNPLAALYFAATQHKDKDGCIWRMTLLPKLEREKMTIYYEESKAKINEHPKTPLIIIPRPVTPRITAQTGRFTYSINDTQLDRYEKRKPWKNIRKLIVPADAKESIKKELAIIQIHEGTMFPDIDGYAEYLANGGL